MTPRPIDTRHALGRSGEERAAAWYAGHGYRIVDRNWRSRIGEIDLVCAGHGVLVFCEVKARGTDRLGAPAEAVTGTKQRRVRRLAALYLLRHDLLRHACGDHEVRFDVAAVRGTTVTVIEGAF